MTLENYAALLLWIAAFSIGLAIAAWTDRPHTPKRSEPNGHGLTSLVIAHNPATCRGCAVFDQRTADGIDRTQS